MLLPFYFILFSSPTTRKGVHSNKQKYYNIHWTRDWGWKNPYYNNNNNNNKTTKSLKLTKQFSVFEVIFDSHRNLSNTIIIDRVTKNNLKSVQFQSFEDVERNLLDLKLFFLKKLVRMVISCEMFFYLFDLLFDRSLELHLHNVNSRFLNFFSLKDNSKWCLFSNLKESINMLQTNVEEDMKKITNTDNA